MKAIWHILRRVLKPADLFLDAGCGAGEYLSLAKGVPNVAAYGVDISISYLQRARSDGIEVVRADVSHLPFRNAVFQVVLCSEVLEHTAVPAVAAAELFRAAQHWVILSSPNYGLLRFATRVFFAGLVDQLDRSVGHLSIRKIGDLARELVRSPWHLQWSRTLHVAPPFWSQLHVHPILARPTLVIERMLEICLPLFGNVSILVYGTG